MVSSPSSSIATCLTMWVAEVVEKALPARSFGPALVGTLGFFERALDLLGRAGRVLSSPRACTSSSKSLTMSVRNLGKMRARLLEAALDASGFESVGCSGWEGVVRLVIIMTIRTHRAAQRSAVPIGVPFCTLAGPSLHDFVVLDSGSQCRLAL